MLAITMMFLFTGNLIAQSNCACCEPEHQQFDFWVGTWTVTDAKGKQLGENEIVKTDGNCLVMESWTGDSGTTGTSMNYYDKTDDSWNQLWVDNQGTILKLKGKFNSGKMIMKSALQEGPQGGKFYNQISWSPNTEGTVSQVWEIYNDEGALLQTLFKGIYQRK